MKLESYSQNLIEQNTRPPPFGRGDQYFMIEKIGLDIAGTDVAALRGNPQTGHKKMELIISVRNSRCGSTVVAIDQPY